MSGLCSAHMRRREPACRMCGLAPEDVFPGWQQKVAEAEAAGKHACAGCGFVFYLTTDTCPRCCRPAKG